MITTYLNGALRSSLPGDTESQRERQLEGARVYQAQQTERIRKQRQLVRAALDSGDRKAAVILAHGGNKPSKRQQQLAKLYEQKLFEDAMPGDIKDAFGRLGLLTAQLD